jgi:hypothetical protein
LMLRSMSIHTRCSPCSARWEGHSELGFLKQHVRFLRNWPCQRLIIETWKHGTFLQPEPQLVPFEMGKTISYFAIFSLLSPDTRTTESQNSSCKSVFAVLLRNPFALGCAFSHVPCAQSFTSPPLPALLLQHQVDLGKGLLASRSADRCCTSTQVSDYGWGAHAPNGGDPAAYGANKKKPLTGRTT